MISGGEVTQSTVPSMDLGDFSFPLNAANPSKPVDVEAIANKFLDQKWDMFLTGTVAQGAGDLFKMFGSIWAMGIQFDAMMAINDRRMDAQENIAGFQKELGLESMETQDKANNRLYGPNGYARELASIQARTQLAIEDKRLEHRERMAAMRNVDDAFSFSRRDYAYGNPFAGA